MPLSRDVRNLMCFPCATSAPVFMLVKLTLMVAIMLPILTTCPQDWKAKVKTSFLQSMGVSVELLPGFLMWIYMEF